MTTHICPHIYHDLNCPYSEGECEHDHPHKHRLDCYEPNDSCPNCIMISEFIEEEEMVL